MKFKEFVERISMLLRVETPDPISPEVGLYDDLRLDSFQAFELLIIVESLAECLVPPMEIPKLFTLGDTFAYYERLRAATLAESS